MIAKPKFGLDLDGVTYDFIKPFDEFLITRGINPDKSQYFRGLSKEENKKQIYAFLEAHPYLWMPLFPGAIEAIEILSGLYQIFPVTARGDFPTGLVDTMIRLKKDKVPYEKVAFESCKGDLTKRLGFKIFVEDSLENAIDIKEKSPNTIVYLIDKEYNQCSQDYGFIRVADLSEVAEQEVRAVKQLIF
jgi:hypothetical protein